MICQKNYDFFIISKLLKNRDIDFLFNIYLFLKVEKKLHKQKDLLPKQKQKLLQRPLLPTVYK